MTDKFIEWLFKMVDKVAPDQDEPNLTVSLIHSNYILISDHTHFAASGFDRAIITITDSLERPTAVVNVVLLTNRPGMGFPINIPPGPVFINYQVFTQDGRELPMVQRLVDINNPVSFY